MAVTLEALGAAAADAAPAPNHPAAQRKSLPQGPDTAMFWWALSLLLGGVLGTLTFGLVFAQVLALLLVAPMMAILIYLTRP